jgi:sugar phosphate isomerase/epimerase
VRGYFDALREFGYDGWVACEDFSTELPLEERTRDNLSYLRSVSAPS